MTISAAQSAEPSDFDRIKVEYDALDPGAKADIRRTRRSDDLVFVPAAYWLLPKGERPSASWLRVLYFLPYARRGAKGASLGAQLAAEGISEARLFQLIRSESPADLTHLRRMLVQADVALDWSVFGKTLFFWNEQSKRRIAEDYFLAAKDK